MGSAVVAAKGREWRAMERTVWHKQYLMYRSRGQARLRPALHACMRAGMGACVHSPVVEQAEELLVLDEEEAGDGLHVETRHDFLKHVDVDGEEEAAGVARVALGHDVAGGAGAQDGQEIAHVLQGQLRAGGDAAVRGQGPVLAGAKGVVWLCAGQPIFRW